MDVTFIIMISVITISVILALVFEKKFEGKKDDSTNFSTVSVSKDDKLNEKLDKIYAVLNHIRWIGLGLAGLFISLLMR